MGKEVGPVGSPEAGDDVEGTFASGKAVVTGGPRVPGGNVVEGKVWKITVVVEGVKAGCEEAEGR